MAMMAEIAGDIPGSLAEATVSDGDSDEGAQAKKRDVALQRAVGEALFGRDFRC
jgi:hypothetical protein